MLYGEVVDVATLTVRDWVAELAELAEYPATAAAAGGGAVLLGVGVPPEGRPKGRLAAEAEWAKVFPTVGLANCCCCCRAERGLAAAWPIRPCHFSRRSRRLRLGLALALALALPDEPALLLPPMPLENPAPPALKRGGVARGAPPRGDGAGAPDRKLGDSIVGSTTGI